MARDNSAPGRVQGFVVTRHRMLPIDLESRIVVQAALLVMALLALLTLSRVLGSPEVPHPGEPAPVRATFSDHGGR